jgi:O-antigen ligase
VLGARLGAILGAAIAAIQLADGLDRAVGGMINPIPFGSTAALFGFMSLIGLRDEDLRGRVFAYAGFAAGLCGSVLSEARGAWLAVPVFGVIVLLYFWVGYGREFALRFIGAMAIVAALVALATSGSIRERLGDTAIMFEGFEFGRAERGEVSTLDQRALMVAYGLEAFRDRPILGYGPQNAVAEVRARAAADGYEVLLYGHLHNEYVMEAVGNGAVGLVTLLIVLAAPIVVAIRSRRDDRYASRLAFACLVSSGPAISGLTGLAFGHDLTNSVFVGGLLALALSATNAEVASATNQEALEPATAS